MISATFYSGTPTSGINTSRDYFGWLVVHFYWSYGFALTHVLFFCLLCILPPHNLLKLKQEIKG